MPEITDNRSKACLLCPRRCNTGKARHAGFCREADTLRAAWAGLHFGEEPPITCQNGSGTIFITGCNLRCGFCQNYQISQDGMGAELSLEDFADLCIALQNAHAENINIVTGSHAVPQIAEGLCKAKKRGLTIPVCWNSSAFETVQAVDMLSEVVDIWLPDLKTLNVNIADAAFTAKDYPDMAKAAVVRMAEHSPLHTVPICGDEGVFYDKMLSGVIVRHLVLPGRLAETRAVIDWFDANLQGRALLSLMTQYTPVTFDAEESDRQRRAFSVFDNRCLSESEYDELLHMLDARTDESGFFQELVQDDQWLPDFNRPQPFSSDLAKSIWHWKYGMQA